jgi:hypothetical protein
MEQTKRDYLNNWIIKANENVAVIQEFLRTKIICWKTLFEK